MIPLPGSKASFTRIPLRPRALRPFRTVTGPIVLGMTKGTAQTNTSTNGATFAALSGCLSLWVEPSAMCPPAPYAESAWSLVVVAHELLADSTRVQQMHARFEQPPLCAGLSVSDIRRASEQVCERAEWEGIGPTHTDSCSDFISVHPIWRGVT